MANYHFEISVISRGKDRSVTRLANYITGQKLYDNYYDKTYYHRRNDVLYSDVLLPEQAPSDFHDLQHLCNVIENAEKRYDARTAREFKASLPNEFSVQENIQIVQEYIDANFLNHGLCAIAAIHEGRNDTNPEKNNPHVHIIVTTRTVDSNGFSKKKYRTIDRTEYARIWREQWAEVQNRAYERNGLSVRVSHESLKVQGKHELEPTIHLSRIDWQKEQKGEHTPRGDMKSAIQERNRKHIYRYQQEVDLELDIELGLL